MEHEATITAKMARQIKVLVFISQSINILVNNVDVHREIQIRSRIIETSGCYADSLAVAVQKHSSTAAVVYRDAYLVQETIVNFPDLGDLS